MAEGLAITERTALGIATVMARKGRDATAVGAALGLAAPAGPAYAAKPGLGLVGTGPGSWLALAEHATANWAAGLSHALADVASVSDQSSAYIVLRLSGPSARTLLQRGAYIDLHPNAFGPGSAATTDIAHIGVILWQIDARPTFDVALFRSYAASFRHWIGAAAASLRTRFPLESWL